MAANLHALWMIALPIVTAVFCWLFWKGRPSVRLVAWSLIALFAPLLFPPHACGRGKPITQGLLGGACMFAVLICARYTRARVAMTVVLGITTLALMVHHDTLVHRDDTIGHPWEDVFSRHKRDKRLHNVQNELRALGEKSANQFPEGWVADQPAILDRLDTDSREAVRYHREVADPLWHTLFTRLYRVRKIPCEVWFPGGTFAEAVDRLEWRDR